MRKKVKIYTYKNAEIGGKMMEGAYGVLAIFALFLIGMELLSQGFFIGELLRVADEAFAENFNEFFKITRFIEAEDFLPMLFYVVSLIIFTALFGVSRQVAAIGRADTGTFFKKRIGLFIFAALQIVFGIILFIVTVRYMIFAVFPAYLIAAGALIAADVFKSKKNLRN
ncbi:MAG: hypothetical protein LBP79_06325 [Clostridiales bacterium]|jgi:hypothetical protein|nr:hypothetical protein [Clostridiales bacterium]